MLNIPASIKNLFQTDGVRKNFRASFPNGELPDITNDNIVQESVRFTESLCSQDVLKFGLTEASVIEFETVGVANMYGMQIRCGCEIDISSLPAAEIAAIGAAEWDGELVELAASDLGWPFFRVPYGLFRVESCPRNHEAMARRKVTAYSPRYATIAKNLPGVPTLSTFPKIVVDPKAFYAEAFNQLVANNLGDLSDYSYYFDDISLFDAEGAAYRLYIREESGPRLTFRTCLYTFNKTPDYILVSDAFDYDLHEAAGKAVAEALTNAGYDLTYDPSGQRVYISNEAALRDKHPEYFSPVIFYKSGFSSGNDHITVYSAYQKIVSGKITPVVNTDIKGYANQDSAFSYDSTDMSLDGFTWSTVFTHVVAVLGPRLDGGIVDVVKETGGTERLQLATAMPAATAGRPAAYKLADYSEIKIKLESTAGDIDVFAKTPSDSMVSLPRYFYGHEIDRASLLDGYLELNAQFGKANRYGQLVTVSLSDLNPVELTPGQYRSFWWDEFNVEPVGKIFAAFADGEGTSQEFTYTFGPGASTYDMSGNAVLQQLYGGSVSRVQQLLAEHFVPHLGPVNFTPIDLNMKGLPYLEDGDYLAVTAEDGTVAYSYNMRHELEGVQVLAATVTSVSGEIIDSEEVNE